MVKFTIRLLIKTCKSLYIKMLNCIFCSEKERDETNIAQLNSIDV